MGGLRPLQTLDEVRKNADLHGLTAALESLTISVQERFREELASFEQKWVGIEGAKATEEVFARRCKEFLNKLQGIRGQKSQSNEIAISLAHPSYQADFSNILRRAQLSGNIRSLPTFTAGKILVDLILSLYLFESRWIDRKGMGAFSNAARYIGSYSLTEKFWLDHDLGTPLVGRGFTLEKGLLDRTYKKLVHAIFLYEGFHSAKDFVVSTLEPSKFLEVFAEEIEYGDSKSILQEYFQDRGLPPPTYNYVRDPQSPDHDPIFQVSMRLPRLGELSAFADSKKEGSKKVSEMAIIELKRDRESRNVLMRLLARKSSLAIKDRGGASEQSLPPEILELAGRLEQSFGLRPNNLRLAQALKTKTRGRSRYEDIPDNDVISLVGALVLDFSIVQSESEFRSLGVEAVHPRICDSLVAEYQLKSISRLVYKPISDWGVNVDRQIAQAVIFALFINDQAQFFNSMRQWIRTQPAFIESDRSSGVDRKLPLVFDEKFSYVTSLQELVQKKSSQLPKYGKVTAGPGHAATHIAICQYDGLSTKGTSSRFVWAKNAAAFEMLKKLKLLENPS